MNATSSFKQLLNKVGIALGAVSIFLLVPVIWVLAAIAGGTATGLSTAEVYTDFIFDRPFILGVFVVCIIWMMVALNSKEAKEI